MKDLWGAINASVGYEIDWSATGTWLGALVTALAVYLAGRISDRNARKAESRLASVQLESLAGLYGEVDLILQHAIAYLGPDAEIGGGQPIATVEYCEDIIRALAAVEVLQLPGTLAVTNHFKVARSMRAALVVSRDKILAFDQPQDLFTTYLRETRAAVDLLVELGKKHGGRPIRHYGMAAAAGDFRVS